MNTVGVFYNSVSNLTRFPNKKELMDNFAHGVTINNDKVIGYHNKDNIESYPIDAGFILGYTLEQNYRKHVITILERADIPRIYVDSNILNYSTTSHEWHRYSLNSVYPSTGTYIYDEVDKTKWDRFSKYHNVSLKPWRTNGNHILILCQRSNGWNLFGVNQDRWLNKTITKIRKHSDRPIIIRMHPGDRGRFDFSNRIVQEYGSKVTISQSPNIVQDLHDCWCTVGYNSTPNVVSLIEGIPNIITDPDNCWGKDISGVKLNRIEKPHMPDREEWIHIIANIHWSNEEVRSGKLWSAIRNYISSVPE
jgi:hypothetical protein